MTKLNIVALIFTLFLIIATWYFYPFFFENCSPQDRGTYGDMYGALNTLFSGLAFFALVVSIIMQTKELSMQREEITLQREEMQLQRIELEKTRQEIENQNKTIFLQRFENTFFNMLSQLNNVVNGFEHEEVYSFASNELFKGKDVLRFIFRKIKDCSPSINQSDYNDLYDKLQSYLGVYYTTLYRILKFIDKQNDDLLSYEEKYEYSSMLRSTLCDDELWLIAINCLIGHGRDRFLPLIVKFKFCKNLSVYSYKDFADKFFKDKSVRNAFPNFQ